MNPKSSVKAATDMMATAVVSAGATGRKTSQMSFSFTPIGAKTRRR